MRGKPYRWMLPFRRRSFAAKEPPQEFLCPISKSLMFDPVVVASGQTFERVSIAVCKDLSFTPTLDDDSRPDFSTSIPNLALKTAIHNWCIKTGSDRPKQPLYSEIEFIIHSLQESSENRESSEIHGSERELLENVAEAPPPLISRAVTDLSPNFYASSSSEESVVANTSPYLPFAARPSCLSYSTSPSTSSEFISDETSTINVSSNSSSEDENFVSKMSSVDIFEQEQAVILLRKITRSNEEIRPSLCSERLLSALKPLLKSRYSTVQINATAALVNLSLDKANKVKIVRAGSVPLLIDILKSGFEEAREHAAGAIFSLALEDENKTALGVLGALQPLLHELRSGTIRSRHDSALALYHLTLVQSNRLKILKLGAVTALVGLLDDADVVSRVVLVICNLASCDEGRATLLDSNAVGCLVATLRSSDQLSESTRENCVAALHSLSRGSLRFKGLAKDASAVEVLQKVARKGNERLKEKVKRILEVLREPVVSDDVDWEAVMKGDVSRVKYRIGGSNSN